MNHIIIFNFRIHVFYCWLLHSKMHVTLYQYLVFDFFLAKVNWSDGTISGTVYSGDPELTHLMEKVRNYVFKSKTIKDIMVNWQVNARWIVLSLTLIWLKLFNIWISIWIRFMGCLHGPILFTLMFSLT